MAVQYFTILLIPFGVSVFTILLGVLDFLFFIL